jgi:hypothetical protein
MPTTSKVGRPYPKNKVKRKELGSRALMVHSCNPSYSGGRDQEDLGSKSAWGSRSRDPISKTHHKKRAGGGLKV